jgi:citrate lyase beta subunit
MPLQNPHLSAYRVGATLYMPVLHPKVREIVQGAVPSPAPTIVLCLEDALHESDVERGVATLTDLLGEQLAGDAARPNIFVRPRSLDMGARLRALSGIGRVDGFVAPKVRVETLPDWVSLLSGSDLRLMPTIETAEFFDPSRLVAFRDVILGSGPDRIAAVRLGGNDLLGTMGLRRERGITAYEGPLSWFLSMAASVLVSSGVPVAAPVFDIIDDLETLGREVKRDVQMGFISKTAIHPAQVPLIERAMRVSQYELETASAILNQDARAVFQIGGVMCEPATHAGWARRVLARDAVFGAEAPDLMRETG